MTDQRPQKRGKWAREQSRVVNCDFCKNHAHDENNADLHKTTSFCINFNAQKILYINKVLKGESLTVAYSEEAAQEIYKFQRTDPD